jgi:glyoxylase-like metal-dependent hydrolase (beta-lactamase superfamily II)
VQKPLVLPLKYLFEDVPAAGTLRQVVPGVHWLQMPLPMALDHINLYMLEDTDGWWIIDSGIGVGPTEEHWEQIFSNALGDKPVKAVLSTHYHPDHIGMAGWLCERWKVPFYMTQAEYLSGLSFSRMQREHFSWTSALYLQRAGFSPEQVEKARDSFNGFGDYIKPMPTSYRRLEDGTTLTINGLRWRVVVGRGHCPEHACLYCETLNILISGDQVIPRITSNVSVMAGEPEANPLKDWLASHEHFLEVLPADALVLPAHNAPFSGLHVRLRHLIEHHEEHLLALEEACADAAPTAVDLLPVLFKRPLDKYSIGLALGECIAHLNYLFQRGQMARDINADGQYTYRSIDDTLHLRLRRNRSDIEDQPIYQV